MVTEVAFLSDNTILIKGDCIVGAFRDAGLAAGAQVVIHNDNSVVSFCDGRLRTGFGARRVIAVSTQVNLKYELHLIINDLGSVLTNRNQTNAVGWPVFLLAGHFTGSTTPAEFIIYAE
jgi:hypothetical protein